MSTSCFHGQARYCTACSPHGAGPPRPSGFGTFGGFASRSLFHVQPPEVLERVVRNICADLSSTESQLCGLSPDDVSDAAASDVPSFLKLGLLSYMWASRGSITQSTSAADAQNDLLRIVRTSSASQAIQALTAAVVACLSVARLCRNEVAAAATYLGRRIAALDTLRAVVKDVAGWAAAWRDDVRAADREAVDTALKLAADALLWAAHDAMTELSCDPMNTASVRALLGIIVGVDDYVAGAAPMPRAAATLRFAEEELFAARGAPQGSSQQTDKLHTAAALLSRVVALLHAPSSGLERSSEADSDGRIAIEEQSLWHFLLCCCVDTLRMRPIGGSPPPLPSATLVGARLCDVLLQLGRISQSVDVWFGLVAGADSSGAAMPMLRDGVARVLRVLELASQVPLNDPSLPGLVTKGWALACSLAKRALFPQEDANSSAPESAEPSLPLADVIMAALRQRCTGATASVHSQAPTCIVPRSVCEAEIAAAGGPLGERCGLSVHLTLQLLSACALLWGDALSSAGLHRAASQWFGRALFMTMHLHHGCPHQICSGTGGPLEARMWVVGSRFICASIRAARSRAAARVGSAFLAATCPQGSDAASAMEGRAGAAASSRPAVPLHLAMLPSDVVRFLTAQGVALALPPTSHESGRVALAAQIVVEDLLAGDGVDAPGAGPGTSTGIGTLSTPPRLSKGTPAAARSLLRTPPLSRASAARDFTAPLTPSSRGKAQEPLTLRTPKSPPRSARQATRPDSLQRELDWLLLRNDQGSTGGAAATQWAPPAHADEETVGELPAPFSHPDMTPAASLGLLQGYRTHAAAPMPQSSVAADHPAVSNHAPTSQREHIPAWSPHAFAGTDEADRLHLSALDADLMGAHALYDDELAGAVDRTQDDESGGDEAARQQPYNTRRQDEQHVAASRSTLSTWAVAALASDTLSLPEHQLVSLLALNMLGVALELFCSPAAAGGVASSAQAAVSATGAAAKGLVALLQSSTEGTPRVEHGRFRIAELLSLRAWGGAVGASALLPCRSTVRGSALVQPCGVAAALHWALPGIARYPHGAALLQDTPESSRWVLPEPREPLLLAAATVEVNRGAAVAAAHSQRLAPPDDFHAAASSTAGRSVASMVDLISTVNAALPGASSQGFTAGSPRLAASLSSPTREGLVSPGHHTASRRRGGGGAFSPLASASGGPTGFRGIDATVVTMPAGYAPTTHLRIKGSVVASPSGPASPLSSARGALLDALRAATAGGSTWASMGHRWSASAAGSTASSQQPHGHAVVDLEVLRANRVQSLLRRLMAQG